MLLDGVQIVLVKTRFPENIGMAARACANMGCPAIRLVDPERWDREKAGPHATPKGQSLLDGVRVSPDLAVAVAESSLVLGTTARTGGWRQALLAPGQAAREVAAALARDEKVSLVFGPEDRGLNNEEITHCQRLVTIPPTRLPALSTWPRPCCLCSMNAPMPYVLSVRFPTRKRPAHPAAGVRLPLKNRSGLWTHSRACCSVWIICMAIIRITF